LAQIVDSLLLECRWPDLAPRYDAALRQAVTFILQRFDAIGIVGSGTIIRGAPDAASDLDIFVIHSELVRQRIQKFFGGVPCELFVNPPQSIRRYFEEDHPSGRNHTAHMLATGTVILARSPVIEELRSEAQSWLSRRVELSEARSTSERYLIATLLEDALDLAERDPVSAVALAGRAVSSMVEYHCLAVGGFLPRHKDLLGALAQMDAELGGLARSFFTASSSAEQLRIAALIADRTIFARGFFEWESVPEKVD
jgi:hypothetical protein